VAKREVVSNPKTSGLLNTRALGVAFASSLVGTGLGLAVTAPNALASLTSTYCPSAWRAPHATCKTFFSARGDYNKGHGSQWICVDFEYSGHYTGQTCHLNGYASSTPDLYGHARAWNGDNNLYEHMRANWIYS
jgi:hypothetical protein